MRPFSITIAGWRTSFARQTVEGEPLHVGERKIVPIASIQSFSLSGLGGRVGGATTTVQPTAIRVEDANGTREIPIRDVTRSVISNMFFAATLLSFIVRFALSRRRG